MKRLYRSSTDRVIAGVCGGLGEYLNIDPVILRVLFAFLVLGQGSGILLYCILWIALPEEEKVNSEDTVQKKEVTTKQDSKKKAKK